MLSRANLLLGLWAAVLGLGAAAAFGAYRAVNGGDGPFEDFVTNLAWPGVLIFAAVTAVVIVGWKANLD